VKATTTTNLNLCIKLYLKYENCFYPSEIPAGNLSNTTIETRPS